MASRLSAKETTESSDSDQNVNIRIGHESNPDQRWKFPIGGFRFLIIGMAGFGYGGMLTFRHIISIAILKMIDQSALYLKEHPDKTIEDFSELGYSLGGDFDWDNGIQQMILSWYMFSYAIFQVPLTKLATRIGARIAMSLCLGICIISNILIPWLSYYGWKWVIVLRLINGLGGSAVLPLTLTIVEKWSLLEEASLGLTIATIVSSVVFALNPLISGSLAAIHWKYSFYVPSAFYTLFCIIWLFVVTDSPEQSRFINARELDIICRSRKTTKTNDDSQDNQEEALESFKPNWLDILKLPHFYIYTIIYGTYSVTITAFTFIVPIYMNQFLKISIAQNGLYGSVIQATGILSSIWPHPFMRLLQVKFNLSLTTARRIGFTLLNLMVALTWTYVGSFHNLQLVVFMITRIFHGGSDIFVTGTLMTNFAEAGVTGLFFSMINTVGNLFVVGACTWLGAYLDQTNQSVWGWTSIFMMGSALHLMISLLYFVIRSESVEFKRKAPQKSRRVSINAIANINN